MRRWLKRGALALLGLLLIGAGALWFALRASLPDYRAQLQLRGLSAAVEVLRDRDGVPHIFAKSEADAYFALGFVHAQDRLWQMEMNRRIGAGRLAEVLGAKALEADRFLRTLGIYRRAEALFPTLDTATQASLAAYTAGVNAFLSGAPNLPPEFLALGVKPEPWRPADSIAWMKMMAWDLGANWRQELLRLRLSQRLTPRQISEFFAPYPGDPRLELPDLRALYARFDDRQIAALAQFAPPPGLGSNNWVVSGARASDGKPLLANDPHLPLGAPSVWYFAHLSAPGLEAIGASLPGVPAIILGRNQQLAWGFTNTAPDVQDLFVEAIDPADSKRYRTPEGWAEFVTREEVLRIKGAPDQRLLVRETRHGPVVSDALASAPALPSNHVLSFRWSALLPDDRTPQAARKLPRATDWESFVAALRDFHVPQQNVVYADTTGNIGFYAAGRVPVRRADNDLHGQAPAPGWDARYDWQGYIPFEELPHAFNPPGGVIVTANHKITPPDYRYHIGHEWFPPFRKQRIEDLLGEREKHDLDSFAGIQYDAVSLFARELLPLLLARAKAHDDFEARLLEPLRDWNFNMTRRSREALVFNAWLREFNRILYIDEMGPLFEDVWDTRSLFVLNVLRDVDGQSRWCDNVNSPARETCDNAVQQAFQAAVRDLRARFGDDLDAWRWGDAHLAWHEHRPFGKVPLLAPVFDIKLPSDGDGQTINVGRYRLADPLNPFANRHAASLRAIYDLADLDRSRYIHSTGQSGHRLSAHYDDLAERWISGDYLLMSMRRADIELGGAERMLLQPAPQQ